MDMKRIDELSSHEAEAFAEQEWRAHDGEISADELRQWMVENGIFPDPIVFVALAQAIADRDADKTGIQVIY